MNERGEKHGDGKEEERWKRKRMGGEPDPGRMRQTRDDARDTYPRLDRNLPSVHGKQTTFARILRVALGGSWSTCL